MKTIRFDDVAALRAEVGGEFGPWGPEIVVTQEMIDAFAALTGDDQWIHVDVERAARESPFGATIAHGFLTLSLLPRLAPPLPFEITGYGNATNFGLDGLRFVKPVAVGRAVRARHRLGAVRRFTSGTLVQSDTQIGVVGMARAAVRLQLWTLYQPTVGD